MTKQEEIEEEEEVESHIVFLGREGMYALISDEDKDLMGLNWHSHKGTGNYYYAARRYYVGVGIREREWMHTTVLERVLGRGLDSDELADHINGDKLDNRRTNLRLASRTQNEANKRKRRGNTSSIYKGVTAVRVGNKKVLKWRASIQKDKKQHYLGTYKTEEEAALAYNERAKEIFGEFAVINEIIDPNKRKQKEDSND